MPRPLQSATIRSGRWGSGQRGFSLVELMIAMLIALFLLGGLVTLVMGTRKTSATQSSLSQLQDNQRIAMTMITDVVQKAGYFPDPTSQDLSSFLGEGALAGVTLPAGQVLGGQSAAATSDTLLVRFYAPQNDTNGVVVDCAGQSNTTASATVWYTNAFLVGTDTNGNPWLQCQSRTSGGGTVLTINLIPNVKQISVLYGVSSAAGDDYSVVQYLSSSQMSATNWSNVTAVKVTLTFLVPQYGMTGGQMMSSSAPNSTATVTRVIPIMSRAGVNT